MQRSLRYILAITCFMALAGLPGVAQVLPEVKSRFDAYQRTALQEKLYVHTNKNFYLTGEILWFKVYNVDGSFNRPFDMSKVAYVEVLNADHTPVMQAKIVLKDGVGSGSIYVPAAIANGNYTFRAYTSWMKNFSPEYFFEKSITIVNAQKSPEEAVVVNNKADDDVQFFPEGGHLVKGLNGKVGFKVTATTGKGVPAFMGAIVDQKNDTVVRFKPLKFGIGSFDFLPVAGNTYKAVLKINNQQVIKSIPAIEEQGYVMQASDKGSSWEINVQTAGIPAENVYLLAHNRQVIKQAQGAVLNNGQATFTLEKSKLDDGISHITLFNGRQQPVCERLVFKRPAKKLVINAQTDNPVYGTRKKVGLDIETKNQNQSLLAANLSVSVFQADSLQNLNEQDIASYLWLSSSLRGAIEGAGYYFEQGAENNEALNNLLITQGWRNFEWNKVLTGKPEIKYLPEYTGHIVTGKLTDAANGNAAKGITAYLAIPGTRVQLFPARSDSTGRLLFNTKDFYGLSEMVVQTNMQYDSTYKIQITNPFAEQYSATTLPAFKLNEGMQSALETNSLNMQVLNVYAAPKLRQFYDPGVDSVAFFGKPDKSYLLDNYVRFTTVEEVLREYTSWLTVAKRRGRFKVTMFNEVRLLEDDPLVLYNGIPVFDMNKAFAIDPLKVKKLDVVNTRYYYGPARFDGMLSFTGYKDDLAGFEIDPRALVIDYEGLQLQRKFYSPVYDTEEQRSSRLPDFRNALYWQPDALTNAQGKTSLSFYTSDQPGKYIGVIQGLTANGEAGSRYFTFEVKK
ncbi:hypothetical protein MUGA111182_03815 [Mucilaginibacter galii]